MITTNQGRFVIEVEKDGSLRLMKQTDWPSNTIVMLKEEVKDVLDLLNWAYSL
jgi:hypothetical protein